MSTNMQDICARYDVSSISVAYQTTYNHFYVFLHWDDPTKGKCAKGWGRSLDDALNSALADLNDQRAPAITEFAVAFSEQTGVSRHGETA